MALRLRITPDRTSYRPGDVLAAVVEVVTEPVSGAIQAAATHLEALQLELCAFERVDLNWVSAKYRMGSTVTEKDHRRITWPLLNMKPVRLCKQSTLLPGSRRLYLVRIQLPDSLPPSFKGSAVRYTYQLEAKATFALQSWKGGTSSSTAQAAEFQSQSSTPSADTPPTPNLPPSSSAANTSPHLIRYSSSSNLKLSRGREAVGQQHRKGPGIVHVKAPVHLWPSADNGDYLSSGSSIMAGDDAHAPMLSYPTTLQEPLDLCIDVTDLLDPGAQIPPPVQRRQASFPKPSAESTAKSGKSFSAQAKTPTVADVERHQDGAAGGVTPAANGAANGVSDTPTAASSRAPRQGVPSSSTLGGRSPACADSASLRSYNLKVGDHPLVRLALHPPLEGRLQLGATIAGTLDFRFSQEAAQQSSAAPKCVQVVIMLESEEVVEDRWGAAGKRQVGSVRKVHDEHQELTPNTLLTHFMFSLPFAECPTFSTHLMQHRWALRFEFTATYQQSGSSWGLGKGSKSPEHITWILPILVWPPSC
ncbi:hypothetical protein ABBQ32_011500 [Trebouxia sp. C0010 RCD-2024]